MCLPEKLSVKIKSANTMENAWIRLDAWFGDKNLFIKDLMQDIKSVTSIKDGDDERLMDYYVTLQAHIEEARSAERSTPPGSATPSRSCLRSRG